MEFQSLMILICTIVAAASIAIAISLLFIHTVLLEIKNLLSFIKLLLETTK